MSSDTTPNRERPAAGTDEFKRLKAEIGLEIVKHIHQHEDDRWWLLSERQEYSHLIGKEAGESGRKLFKRWRDAARTPTPPDKTRPHEGRAASEANLAEANAIIANREAKGETVSLAQAMLMRHGAAGVRVLDSLEQVCLAIQSADALLISAAGGDGDQLRDYADLVATSAKIRLDATRTWTMAMKMYFDGVEAGGLMALVIASLAKNLKHDPEALKLIVADVEAYNASPSK